MTNPDPNCLAHPVSGQFFRSPVPPGAGWPGDPATAQTPIAHDAEQVATLAKDASSLTELEARSSVCRACPRLVTWREQVARQKRAAFADQPYWGRPVPSFGPDDARLLIVGLAPAANGANRTGRMFTGDRSGDWLYAALYRTGLASQPTSQHAGDGLRLIGARIIAPVRCAPPANQPTTAEKATCGGWFDRELAVLGGVTGVLALGGIAWQSVLAAAVRLGWQVPRPRPRFGHGATAELISTDGRGVRLVGCYHVSQQNTFTGKLTEPMLDAAIALAAK